MNNLNPKANSGYRYLVVIIDVKSRYVWANPIKKKTPLEVLSILKIAVNDCEKQRAKINIENPLRLTSDEGSEFKGAVNKFCNEKEIVRYYDF